MDIKKDANHIHKSENCEGIIHTHKGADGYVSSVRSLNLLVETPPTCAKKETSLVRLEAVSFRFNCLFHCTIRKFFRKR